MPTDGESFLFPMSAKARLTCVIRIYFYQSSISICNFIFDFLKKGTPTNVVNLLGKYASGHTFDIQIFANDCLKLSNQMRDEFMLKIVALIFNMRVNFLHLLDRFSPTVRKLLSAGNFSLRFAKLFFGRFKILPIINLRSVRQGNARFRFQRPNRQSLLFRAILRLWFQP